jgi:hypothetical protein
VLLAAITVPCFGAITVDPGARPMVWHVFGAGTLLAILNWRTVGAFLREHAGLRDARSNGFAFATTYALLSVPLCVSLFDNQPTPRFNDIFLVGIALTVYFFSWEPATYLFAVSVIASAWILPPHGSIRVEGFAEWYRLISFSLVSVFVILLLARLKAKRESARMQTAGD